MVTFQPDDEYHLQLSVFEGPIDLLLYLIRKKELDIHEISLAEIAREYLEYVELIRLIDLERAGDFIVVASTLMRIKARSLFDRRTDEEVDGDGDPRERLIRYLMEYEKLGGVADKLAEKEQERRVVFPRGGEKDRIESLNETRDDAPDYMLFDLLSALRDVLKTAPKKSSHDVEFLKITPVMKQKEIMTALAESGELDFISLVEGQPRIIVVVTFIAMLELIKLRKIRIRQSHQFGAIMLQRRDEHDEG